MLLLFRLFQELGGLKLGSPGSRVGLGCPGTLGDLAGAGTAWAGRLGILMGGGDGGAMPGKRVDGVELAVDTFSGAAPGNLPGIVWCCWKPGIGGGTGARGRAVDLGGEPAESSGRHCCCWPPCLGGNC